MHRSYLENDPHGIDLGGRPGDEGYAGPDGEEGGLAAIELQEGLRDRTLVLVAGHHEKKDDERREAQQGHHAQQRKPVHLPEVHRRRETNSVQHFTRKGNAMATEKPT